jgi:signal peptidase II
MKHLNIKDSLKRNGLFISAVSLTVVVLDQVTKHLIEAYVRPYEAIKILPVLQIVNVKNKGAAFSLFSSLGNDLFIIISVIAITFIAIYTIKLTQRLEVFLLALVLGGALGNFIDRLTLGHVVDFIDLHIGNLHWPAFNIADSALSIGLLLYIAINLWPRRMRSLLATRRCK